MGIGFKNVSFIENSCQYSLSCCGNFIWICIPLLFDQVKNGITWNKEERKSFKKSIPSPDIAFVIWSASKWKWQSKFNKSAPFSQQFNDPVPSIFVRKSFCRAAHPLVVEVSHRFSQFSHTSADSPTVSRATTKKVQFVTRLNQRNLLQISSFGFL